MTTLLTTPSFLSVVEPDLQRVRAGLRELSKDLPESLRPLTHGGALDGGKMLRSTLLLLWGRAVGAITDDHIQAGVILELLHNATLLHDDVLDEGRLRRGVATVNHRWGNRTAVLFGDLLLGKVLELSARGVPEVRATLGRIALRTCEGEISQTARVGHFTLSEPEYLAIIGRKTAALFDGACYIGAYLADPSSPASRAAAHFGYQIGMAYQIMDDLLDIAGDGDTLRKTLGTDLHSAKPTLLLIHALSVLPERQKTSLLLRLRSHAAGACELLGVFESTGSVDYVLGRLRDHADAARDALRDIRQSRVRDALIELSRWISQEALDGSAI